jgi:putative transposase
MSTTQTKQMVEAVMAEKKKRELPPELIDQILKAGYTGPDDFGGPDGFLHTLVSAVVNRALNAELDHHLGYAKGEAAPEDQSNRRNGHSTKKLRGDLGPVEAQIPRDREGAFEPHLVKKHQRSMLGFDSKILAMYARGMSTRDIQNHMQEVYGLEVSPQLVSDVTEAVCDEVKAWQTRALEPVYLVVYLDALVVKIRDRGVVTNKSVYLAVGVLPDGTKDVLGMWIYNTEGAKFWLAILSELRQRGVRDILVICADGLKGLPEAVEASFPKAVFQTCIVHVVRASTRFVPWKNRRAVCADLRAIYTAANATDALAALEAFEARWGGRFPMIGASWRARWNEISPFLGFPPEIRRAIYTTNAIEALNRQVRKVIKTKGALPDDDAALKLIFLVLRNAKKSWGAASRDWTSALAQFAIIFGDRIPQ